LPARASTPALSPGPPLQVISLGHKENATLAQVRTYTEMESHEEKLHKMIIQSKINDTKDLMKRKAMEIDKSKVERKLERGYGGGGGSGGFGGSGISSSTYFGEDGGADRMGGASAPRMAPVINDGFGMSGGGGGGGSGGFSLAKGETRTAMPSKGLVLGKGLGKTNAFIESLRAEGDAVEVEPSRSGGPASAPGSAPHAQRPAPGSAESVAILIEEKVSCQLKKDGGLESLEVQGTMQLEIHNDQDAFCRVQVAPLPALAAQRGVQFKTHPNIDKALHGSSNVLALKDPSRPFPTGSALGILKWRCAPKEEAAVPLQLNCWPSISGAQSFVSIEYEATHEFDLHNLQVTIPLPASREVPVVNSCDGEFRHDVRKNTMTWMVDLVDQSNRNGSMEFAVPAADAGSFFPIDIQFSSTGTYCGIGVEGVQKSSDGAPVKHQVITKLATDSYTVQ